MNSEKEKFLYSIGGIVKKENENFLSDITYAKCICNEEFFNLFFQFCFPNENAKPHYLEREEDNKSNGRNDFQIYTDKGIYIVENKINDKDISKYLKYLHTVNEKKSHIVYIFPKNYDKSSISELENNEINYFYWEDFIDNVYVDYPEFHDFCIMAAGIIGHLKLPIFYRPKYEDIKVKGEICDMFFNSKLKNKYSANLENKVIDPENFKFYGYYIWASAWFGIAYCPNKGVYFCFTIGNGGDYKIENKTIYQYLKPLGRYYKDKYEYEYKYYEIKESSIITIDNYKDILTNAFNEFCEMIILYKENKTLKEFIEDSKRT